MSAVPTGCSDPRPGTPSELPAPAPPPADAQPPHLCRPAVPAGPLHLLSPPPTMDTCLSNFSSILSSWGDLPRPSRRDQLPYYGRPQRGASCLEHRSQLTVMHVGHCLVSSCPCEGPRAICEDHQGSGVPVFAHPCSPALTTVLVPALVGRRAVNVCGTCEQVATLGV